MEDNIAGIESQTLLNQIKKESAAKNILMKPTSFISSMLISSLCVGIASLLLVSSGSDLPWAIEALLISGFVGSLLGISEIIVIRRRLEAAIALILLQEERNKKN